MTEVWKDVTGFEGVYRISSLGRVWSKPRQGTKSPILRTILDCNGYKAVLLRHEGKSRKVRVHTLVAEAFLDRPNTEWPHVNHLNSDKTDNRLENLEWVSAKENVQHAIKAGKWHWRRPQDPRLRVALLLVEKGVTKADAARLTGLPRSTINAIVLKIARTGWQPKYNLV